MRRTVLFLVSVFVMFYITTCFAAQQCPVGLVTGMTLDEEFGPGSADRFSSG